MTERAAGRPVAAPRIEARSLYRFFRAGEEETLALQGVSMEVDGGEVVVVVGPSGSGKSTLLACLAGLDEPDGGMVLVDGQRISHHPERTRTALRARRVGLLFQSGNLFDHLTVAQNIALAQHFGARARVSPRARASPRALRTSRRMELLSAVGLAARASAYPDELSGGQLARAGLAVALANDPAVLLADEPTGELDSATETQILWLLTAAAGRGVAVLVASHSPLVAAIAHRTVRLEDGKVT